LKLPNRKHVIIHREKITEYLLSFSHPTGYWKAQFFSAFGFAVDLWEDLALALFHHAANNDVTEVVKTDYGIKYVIDGSLESPDERNPWIRTIWFVKQKDDTPRFITAYPLESRTL